MKRSPRIQFKVGLLVLGAGGLLTVGLLWIAGSRFLRPVASYTILFEDSVSGLAAGANVEYQGVVVGRVQDVRLTPHLPPKVAVHVDVAPDTPVRKDTVAVLAGSVVTGIKYIELQGGSGEALPPGGIFAGDVTSLEEFRDRMAEIAERGVAILRRLDENVFSQANTARITEVVRDLGEVVHGLNTTMDTFDAEGTGQDLADAIRKVSAAAQSMNAVLDDFHGRREDIYGSLVAALRHGDEAALGVRELVRSAAARVEGPGTSVGTLLEQLTASADRLQETLEVIRSDPSIVVWGSAVPEREFER